MAQIDISKSSDISKTSLNEKNVYMPKYWMVQDTWSKLMADECKAVANGEATSPGSLADLLI